MGEQDHKVAIITGGSQGLGAGLVAASQRRDWTVVATSRTIKPTWVPAVLAADGTCPVQAGHHLGGGVARHPAGGVETSASFALAESYGGCSSNLPLEDLTDGKAWIAFGYDGQELEAEHGGPARLLVPHLYLWKSAKWVRGSGCWTRTSRASSPTGIRMMPRGSEAVRRPRRWTGSRGRGRLWPAAPRSASGAAPRPRWWRPASRSPGRCGWAGCARRSSHTAELVAVVADRRGWSWRCLTWLAGHACPARLLLASCSCWTTTVLDGLRRNGGCSRRKGGLELGPQAGGEDIPGAADQHGHLIGDHPHVAGGADQHR
jgi:hypothetical protein